MSCGLLMHTGDENLGIVFSMLTIYG